MKKSPRQLLGFAIIAVLAIGVRLGNYEPIGRSVSTYDTQGFVASSKIPFWSPDFFVSGRPATISLLYKLLEPPGGYQFIAFSSPAEDQQQPLLDQPSFRGISTAQSFLALAAWLLLAFVVFRRIRNPWFGAIGAMLILLFAFTPPAAEWDYILLSEPLSLTLFVFLLSISIELVARPLTERRKLSRGTILLAGGWLMVLILWIFARDTNVYMFLPIIAVLLFQLLLSLRKKRNPSIPLKFLIGAIVLLGLLFAGQSSSAQASGRWINPFFNNMLHRVFPYPQRLAFFENKGMPITDEVLALRSSPGNEDGFFEIPYLMDWVKQNGARTYIVFLLSDPAWTAQIFFDGVNSSFSENRQPFFGPDPETTPAGLSYLGDLLHPNSTSVIWVVAAELAVFGFLSWRNQRKQYFSLFVLFAVFFVGELLMLFVGIEGDALGIIRHGIGSVMPIQLSVWLLSPLILDSLATRTR